MTEFFNVLPPDEARALLLAHVRPLTGREIVPTADALGRVTAAPATAPHPLPAFRRSAMDGYAVRAAAVGPDLESDRDSSREKCGIMEQPPHSSAELGGDPVLSGELIL